MPRARQAIRDALLGMGALSDWVRGAAGLTAALTAVALYAWLLVAATARVRMRVALFAPVMALLLALPNALFSRDTHILGVGAGACVASWWASHKALSALLNYRQTPDASAHPRALLSFCAALALPVRVARVSRQGVLRPLARAFLLVAALAVVAARFLPVVATLVWPARALARALIVYAASAFIADICAALAESLGVRTERAFRAPWCAASLREFWTKRWNLPASDTLRDAVYLPLVDALRKPHHAVPPPHARLVAILATFIVSGIMHEFILYCLTGAVSLEMIAFFSLHGVLVVAEGAAGASLTALTGQPVWRRVPLVIRRLATVSLIVSTGHWLFFEPMVRHAIDAKAGENLHLFYSSLAFAPRRLQSSFNVSSPSVTT